MVARGESFWMRKEEEEKREEVIVAEGESVVLMRLQGGSREVEGVDMQVGWEEGRRKVVRTTTRLFLLFL